MSNLSKIKRNEPCPCGSGKKYKHCHGKNPTPASNVSLNDEVNHLHQTFISDALNHYDEKMDEVTNQYQELLQVDDEATAEIYKTGLKLWTLFNVPFLAKNETIFGKFYHKYRGLMSLQARDIVSKWADSVPSVYEVTTVPDDGSNVTVTDITSNISYEIPHHQGKDFVDGSLIIGTMVPLANSHSFIYTIIRLFQHNKDRIIELFKQHSTDEQGLKNTFPNYLADVLVQSMDEFEWSNPLHGEVAQLFANHVIQKNISDDIIFKGVSLWKEYCDKENPSLKNIEPYAASLEYLVHKTLLANNDITQSQLADEYETSAGSISTNYRKLTGALDEI